MQQRRGTAAEWTSADPILGSGEIGYETDTGKFKIGDGSTAWSSLTYFASIDSIVDGAPALLDTLNELAAAIGDDEDFITTINTDLAGKLSLSGGSMTGTLVLAADPTNPTDAATKSYVDDEITTVNTTLASHGSDISDNADSINTLNSTTAAHTTSIGNLETAVADFKHIFVSQSTPTADANDGTESLQEGDVWYDRSNGHLYVYVNTENSDYAWVEIGGTEEYTDGSYGINNQDFPSSPSDGDTHKGYIYDSDRSAWNIDKSTEVGDNSDVTISSIADDEVLMYNDTTSVFENVPGIRLDASGDIPVGYLDTVINGAGAGYATLGDVETSVTTELSNLVDSASSTYNTLGKIDSYLTANFQVQTETAWGSDSSTPAAGAILVSTGTSVRVKIGDGASTWSNLEFVPTNSYITTTIATSLADYAQKAGPTFTGTVSLPSTTSIGNVDATEISYLDGVTSAVQTQLDAKAPSADPTFTGTVSGITKGMVGLGNVDNTADADKPVSDATQTALDAKAALAGATFTGDVEAPNLVVSGNLTVQGSTTTISASNLSVRDNMIYLNQAGLFTLSGASGDGTNVVYTTSENHDIKVGDYITVTGANPSSFDISGEGYEVTAVTSTTITVASTVTDTYVDSGQLRGKSHANPDLGWAAGRYDTTNGSGYGHAGVFRDATDGVFKFFDGYVPEPDEDVFVDTSHASFELAPVSASKIVFPDGTEQDKAGVPSLTSFTEISSTDNQATVSGATGDGAAVTITTSADHGFSQGDSVVIAGMDPAGYDGTYTIASVPTTTTFTVAHTETGTFVTGGTATVTTPGDYTLNTLDHQDNIVEMNSSVAATFTIPTNANLAWPVGASMDVFATGTGEITIAGDTGVTVNATPGLTLRTQWSSATLLKRGTDSWVVYGDLKA